ncbi:MAG: HEAT repeat domain-containing protein [Planctomycetes bacterium]|nr:HEAT repeat domain-containing protein [Planctomycetota bacterium]
MRILLCCTAALFAACASSNGNSRAPSDAIVRARDLPERHRAVLEAWQKGERAWEVERDAVRADPELARFVVDNLLIEMVQAFDRSRISKPGEKAGPFERAQRELVLLAEHSTPLLAQSLALKDGVIGFLAADTLTKIGARAVPDVAALLADKHTEARRRAAELLGRLPSAPEGEPSVLEALAARLEKDEAWIVRAQAALALGARGARQDHKGFALARLSTALADEDATVAESAAKALGELGEVRAVPRLIDGLSAAVTAGRPGVVDALNKSLMRLSGSATKKDVAQWRAWWKAHDARQ